MPAGYNFRGCTKNYIQPKAGPIPFSYFKGFWIGSGMGVYGMGMGVPLLGVPGISLEQRSSFLGEIDHSIEPDASSWVVEKEG